MTYYYCFFALIRQHILAHLSENMPRTSPYNINLSDAERTQLECQARKYTSSYYSVVRAKMILLAAQGQPNDQIAASLSVPRQIVSKWRKRFFEERLAGLEDEPRTGRPPVFSPRSGRAG
jgi:transposase-like protein